MDERQQQLYDLKVLLNHQDEDIKKLKKAVASLQKLHGILGRLMAIMLDRETRTTHDKEPQ